MAISGISLLNPGFMRAEVKQTEAPPSAASAPASTATAATTTPAPKVDPKTALKNAAKKFVYTEGCDEIRMTGGIRCL